MPPRLEALQEELCEAKAASLPAASVGSSGGGALASLKPHELHERVRELTQENERLREEAEGLRHQLKGAQAAAAASAAEVQVGQGRRATAAVVCDARDGSAAGI